MYFGEGVRGGVCAGGGVSGGAGGRDGCLFNAEKQKKQ